MTMSCDVSWQMSYVTILSRMFLTSVCNATGCSDHIVSLVAEIVLLFSLEFNWFICCCGVFWIPPDHAHKSILTITNNTLQKKNTDLDDPQTQNYLSHHFADFSNEKHCFVPYYWDWTRQPMMNQSECEAVALSGRREPLVSVATGGGQLMAWTTWPLVPLVSWHIFTCCHFTTPTFPFN